MKRMISVLLSLMICISYMAAPAYAAESFEKGDANTFFAPKFGGGIYDGIAGITDSYRINKDTLAQQGAKAYAKTIANALNRMPEGRRIIELDPRFGAQLASGLQGGYFVSDEKFNLLQSQMDGLFKEIHALGAQVDYVFDDDESWPTVYNLEMQAIYNFKGSEDLVTSYTEKGHLYEEWMKEKLIATEDDPLYISTLRPALEEAGFVFSENYDLEYINIFPGAIEPRATRFYESNPPEGAERAYIIFNSVVERLAEEKYCGAITDTIKKYYPDVKNSNWGLTGKTGEIDRYDFNGNLEAAKGDHFEEHIATTHANAIMYGADTTMMGCWIDERPPREWRYDTYLENGFNMAKVDLISLADAALSADGKATCWISNKGYVYRTDYYTELLFHAGMMNPDPFLFWPGNMATLGDDLKHLDEVFVQLGELVGFEDRKSLVDDAKNAPVWDDRYILTGMSAGGKNVWRITPDLYAPGVTMENFLVDEKAPAFRIGNQNVVFPKDSYIYEPEDKLSQYGYWVISPEGTRPEEYRDNKHPMPGAPVPEAEDGTPLGYMHEAATEMPDELDLSRSKDKADASVVAPDDGETSGETEVEEVVVQTLELNPIRDFIDGNAVLREDLPKDIQGHWAEHTLSNMFAFGIMQGTGKGMEPDNQVSRAEFIAMLERILGTEKIAYTGDIADVAADAWYADVMQTAVSGGWMDLDAVTGETNPESSISRADMCAILVRALTLKETESIEFADSVVMPAKVRDNVSRVAAIGLIQGYEDGKFRPNGFLTRAETATVFESLLAEIPALFEVEE